ncbi:hypothetical protein [Acaryochloris marina]|uniref:Uncharacterized protein n=1 Tax=Acaryochloris marina (strain MBIC 11017) TaxID=329726 RepID=A8ZPW5_ACAM1|nr:hypothetical protein [Acaryochloris marina]ABW33012.1 hypothetical protein AM1_F0173 [Acaryochloris marina MBIC11017]BDM83201.1 hypothetical protein AM10699_60620 [Acaryochloris marina MBIC10699]
MTTNPFSDYYEQAWIDHQTDYGQHPDPCIGLPSDQIQDRVASLLSEFNPLISPESETALSIWVGIIQRFYRDISV